MGLTAYIGCPRQDINMAVLTETDVFPWVERTLGGTIEQHTRQGGRESGGRPGWFITCNIAGNPRRFYIRGDRGSDFGFTRVYSLQREMQLLKLLFEEGIPVPEVIASSENPGAIIMEFVPGENDFTLIDSPDERRTVARDFLSIMTRWQQIEGERFAAIGFDVPSAPADYIIPDLEVWEQGHFPLLREPIPLVRFVCQWLRRNIPRPPARPVLVQGDTGPGQFIFADGRVRAVVDFELAVLGDPMRDLAHIRTRDVWYPTGDLPGWFRDYSEISGVELDFDRLRYYSVMGMFNSALALGPVVQALDPSDEHAEWITQEIWSKCATIGCVAEAVGIELDDVAIPEANPTYLSRLVDVLGENLEREQLPHIDDSFRSHRLQTDLRLIAHLRNLAMLGRQIEAIELDEMGSLLGRRPASLREGNLALDRFVTDAGPDLDETLIRYFHRQSARERALMRGGMGRAEHAVTSPISY